MHVALLIVGGGPAGLAAARGYRDAGGTGPVWLVADEGRVPYRRPPLTKDYLRGELGPAKLPIEPEDWYAEQRVTVARTQVVGLAVDRTGGRPVGEPAAPVPAGGAGGTAWLQDGRKVRFDQVVLATGSSAARLPIDGADRPGVHVLRTVTDVATLLERLGDARPVAVVGSGFIGCEIAASLRRRGHPVTMVTQEAVPQDARLGREVGERLAEWLRDEGVELLADAPVERICPGDAGALVVDSGRGRVTADVVVLGAGAVPRLELARQLGLDVSGGGIPTDAAMRTALPGVLAAGDVALARHAIAGRRIKTEHWGDALTQGEAAGRSAAGQHAEWADVPGFWSTIGDHTLKYAAWGDGFDRVDVDDRPHGGFVARYTQGGVLVGVLAHGADQDYELAQEQLAQTAAAV